MAADDQSENLAGTLTEVSERVSVLVREEIELAKAEVMHKISSLARGAAAQATTPGPGAEDRPELMIAAAFAGGFLLAMILKRLGR